MLSPEQFNTLCQPERYAILKDHGVFLGVSTVHGVFKVVLFQLFNFYAEVWLNQKTGELLKTWAFTSYSKLDAYLNDMPSTGEFFPKYPYLVGVFPGHLHTSTLVLVVTKGTFCQAERFCIQNILLNFSLACFCR